jgi:hypothetical protein
LHAVNGLKAGPKIYLGSFGSVEDAARVFDFAGLRLRGVDTQTVTNFDKGEYLGADGALLSVEAALPGLGSDKHRFMRHALAAALGAEGATDSGSSSSSSSESDSGSGSGNPASQARQPPARLVAADSRMDRMDVDTGSQLPSGAAKARPASSEQLPPTTTSSFRGVCRKKNLRWVARGDWLRVLPAPAEM